MYRLKTLNRLLFAVTVFTYIIVFLIFGFWDYTYRKNEIIENIDSKLFNVAASLKYILPEDFHVYIIDLISCISEHNKRRRIVFCLWPIACPDLSGELAPMNRGRLWLYSSSFVWIPKNIFPLLMLVSSPCNFRH